MTFSRDSTHSAVIDKSLSSPTLVQVTATVDQGEERKGTSMISTCWGGCVKCKHAHSDKLHCLLTCITVDNCN